MSKKKQVIGKEEGIRWIHESGQVMYYRPRSAKIKPDQRGPETWWADLFPPPIGYRYVTYTYLPTHERVMRGWPVTGIATFRVPIQRSRESNLDCFTLSEMFEMKRYQLETQKTRGKWVGSKDPLVKDRPTINQLCTDTQWDDGGQRLPCTLKIRFGDGQASVTISDENIEASITTTAETVQEALQLLEEALAASKVAWRPWPAEFKRKGKK